VTFPAPCPNRARSMASKHHKFAIFDGKTLLNGSYDWTRSAFTKNEENVLVTDKVHWVEGFSSTD
jgi:phosphatidylserine/phosphatidylglycerophosphate/cardiolipin synthase-like enzyme